MGDEREEGEEEEEEDNEGDEGEGEEALTGEVEGTCRVFEGVEGEGTGSEEEEEEEEGEKSESKTSKASESEVSCWMVDEKIEIFSISVTNGFSCLDAFLLSF